MRKTLGEMKKMKIKRLRRETQVEAEKNVQVARNLNLLPILQRNLRFVVGQEVGIKGRLEAGQEVE